MENEKISRSELIKKALNHYFDSKENKDRLIQGIAEDIKEIKKLMIK